jgi:exodeoxyribonuclease I
MGSSFFFYDLETSGFDSREQRIMQFAGIRKDMDLQPVGEPVNLMIKMTDEILPDPDAVLLTGITPQQTIADGLTEAEFLQYFTDEIATPGTIFVGYNTVRFDDEFVRNLHYRNLYDPYEWFWQDGRSRWDLLDVVRMTRALRPDGIKWPFDPEGRPTNRLELLTKLNGLDHAHAHDALSDVEATIAVARLIREEQRKLFDYLLDMRDKKKVAGLVESGVPFVYASGRYPGEFQKTTLAVKVCDHPQNLGVLVYDLRHDPEKYFGMSVEELCEVWRWKKDATEDRLPVKVLQFNKCPAVADRKVLDVPGTCENIKLDKKLAEEYAQKLRAKSSFATKIYAAFEMLEEERQARYPKSGQDVDNMIYDGFFAAGDKNNMRVVRAAKADEITDLNLKFADKRLAAMLPRYKARNFPKKLSAEEREEWEELRAHRLLNGGQNSRMAKYLARLQELSIKPNITDTQKFLLEDLKLYAESIMPDVNS